MAAGFQLRARAHVSEYKRAYYGGGSCCIVLIVFLSILLSCIHSLEYEQLGLHWSATKQQVGQDTGIYLLGVGDTFLKFPKMQQPMYFMAETFEGRHSKPLQSRTKDGVPVSLQVSFFYRIVPSMLFAIYQKYGMEYEQIVLRKSIERLTGVATRFSAKQFFAEREMIETEMSGDLGKHLADSGFDIPNFQLRAVNLPERFDNSVSVTQVKKQDIKVAKQQQQSRIVQLRTTVLEVISQGRRRKNIALGNANASVKKNMASMERNLAVTKKKVDSYAHHRDNINATTDELFEFIKIRMLHAHASSKLTMNIS